MKWYLNKIRSGKAEELKEICSKEKLFAEKVNLFLLKCCVFSVYGLLLAFLASKYFLHMKYKESLRFRKS